MATEYTVGDAVLSVKIASQSGAYNGSLLAEVTDKDGIVSIVTLTDNYDANVGRTFDLNLDEGDKVRLGITTVGDYTIWSDNAGAIRTADVTTDSARINFEDDGGTDFNDVVLNASIIGTASVSLPESTSIAGEPYPLQAAANFDDLTTNHVESVAPPENWFTDNGNGKIEVGKGTVYGLNSDSNVIELEQKPGDAANLYTIIDSQLGTIVEISLDIAQRVHYTSEVSIMVDGVEVDVIKPVDNKAFTSYTFEVGGTGEPMRIEFKATDSNGTGVLLDNINIKQVFLNQHPEAADDYAEAVQDKALTIAVAELLQNDVDPDGDAIHEFSVQAAENGTVSYVGNEVIFVPDVGYTGPASFKYTITDGKGGFDTATVNLMIEAALVEAGAVAMDDAVDGYANNALFIAPETLLGNDFDAKGGDIHGVAIADAVNGNVYWNGTHVVFEPTADYTGPASFTYTIKNDAGDLDTATVNLTIADNTVMGTDADDAEVRGSDLNEVIIGGLGNDNLYGEAGADTFTWRLEDVSLETPSIDIIKDGELSDSIDISDLLTDTSLAALDIALDFSEENGSTVIDIHVDEAGGIDQTIVIEGFDLTAGGTLSDVQMIENLMNSGHLIVD